MPQGDKSSYTGKQRREAHHIEEGYKKRGISTDEAERRAWATVNKQDGGAKKSGSGRSSSSHGSSSHSASHKSSRRRHTSSRSGSRSGSRSRSRSRRGGRSRSNGFTLFGLRMPSYTPYLLGGLGLCGLVYGLLQIDSIRESIDPMIDDIGEFFGVSERPELMAHSSFDSGMSTIH